MRRVSLLLVAVTLVGVPAWGQSRPLATEDPETVPSGNILLESGIDFGHGITYTASGLRGNLWRVGTFGLSFGVSPIAEIQLDGGLRNRLSIVESLPAPLSSMLDLGGKTTTSDVEDIAIGAKIRVLAETETRPSMAIRFWTRLPNAGNESGLGLDTTDFHFGLAVGKTTQSIRMVGNFGFGILPDPVRGDRQNDVLDFGFSVARAVRTGVEMVGEINGRINTRDGTPPIGTESRSLMKVGSRLTRGPVRADAALAIGITDRDPGWGFTAGVTWVFKAFEVR